jgi:hypothetical protein
LLYIYKTSIKACQFHLSQAWYRKIQNLGFSPEYQNHESETGQWLKNFLGLCFLDPAEVEDCFVYDIQVTYQCAPSHVSVTGPSRLILGGNFSSLSHYGSKVPAVTVTETTRDF